MNYRVSLSFILALLYLSLWAAEKAVIPDDPYQLLTKIPSFFELFSQKGLTAYSADATVEGKLYDNLVEMAKNKGMDAPEFIEIYRINQGVAFKLKNKNYPPYFRQIVDELFTPVQAFDQVIKSIESRRELTWFNQFKAATTVEASWVQYNDTPHVKLIFIAKPGAGLDRHHDDTNGTEGDIETDRMTFILFPEQWLIRMLKVTQKEKKGQTETSTENKFTFEYRKLKNSTMPAELTIEKNGQVEIRFKAVYMIKNDFVVFAEKLFGYRDTEGGLGKVRIAYSNYAFNEKADITMADERLSRIVLEKEADAEKIFNNAKEFIFSGENEKAKKMLRKIIKNYPETTYAEQAKTLLDGLSD
ncbi:MAG: hypothetical protein A2293_09710 [Elusimicrobia bacterium RIFOXYB2_FULL_49_7]|nr:MAG: hypothetical protein A2293_09710 [Elusimicrobia bacterium RIFOXYB2_FULL_49_7]